MSSGLQMSPSHLIRRTWMVLFVTAEGTSQTCLGKDIVVWTVSRWPVCTLTRGRRERQACVGHGCCGLAAQCGEGCLVVMATTWHT